MIDLNELSGICEKYSKMRIENGAKIDEDPLKHCSGELAEAIIQRQKMYDILESELISKETKNKVQDIEKTKYADELMDVLYCVLVACKQDDIDVEKALMNNIDKNKKRALCTGDKK